MGQMTLKIPVPWFAHSTPLESGGACLNKSPLERGTRDQRKESDRCKCSEMLSYWAEQTLTHREPQGRELEAASGCWERHLATGQPGSKDLSPTTARNRIP